jgi:hypothetical protein
MARRAKLMALAALLGFLLWFVAKWMAELW